MPENEILAPVYIKGKIATPVYPAGHAFRLYFRAGTSFVVGDTGDEDNWRVVRAGDDKGSIAGMLDNLFDRASTRLPADSTITEIALWHSVPNAPNVLDHYNTLPIGNDYGSGAGIASAYAMYVYGAALREQFRFTLFDGAFADPQKYPATSAPVGDDGSVTWFFTRSDYGLATQDGLPLVREVSSNTGYNRKLARSYGRSITP